jgi:hypothetical protein
MEIKNLPPLQSEGRKSSTDDREHPVFAIFSAGETPA